MIPRPMMWAGCALLGALATGCQPDATPAPLAPSFATTSDIATVSGRVLGPDGETSICASLPDPFESVFLLRVIDPAAGTFASGPQFITCPSNQYAFSLAPGSYLIRATLSRHFGIGALPVRSIDRVSVAGDQAHDIVIREGSALRGAATIDGAPLEGVDMTIGFAEAPGFAAGFGGSGADGAWTEFFRAPYVLQNDRSYVTLGCGALGVLVREGPPDEFVFPTSVSAINCVLETAPSVRFSHTHTRLAVTPMPADFGGQDFDDRFGIGWGVQFPVAAGQSPRRIPVTATHLFNGGLMIGIAPDRILMGGGNQLDCGPECRDLGLDGEVHYTPETPNGRMVTWRYSDGPSSEGVGLRITQRSFDGRRPADYVLFQFDIKNGGTQTVTFYAGTQMDWDIEDDVSDDYGYTEMEGRLMVTASAGEQGMHAGELLLGAPVSGNVFYNTNIGSTRFSTAEQFQALSGGLQNLSVGPGDAHLIHGMGPISLKRGQTARIWVALVAGESREQLLANARAAAADVARRDENAVDPDGALILNPQRSGIRAQAMPKQRTLP